MKKLYLLALCVLGCMIGSTQNYAPWTPDQGPLNFMTLDVQNHPYVRLSTNHGSGQDNYENYPGIYSYGGRTSHKLITSPSNDPCRCFQVGNTYQHESYLLPSWSGIPGEHQDTVIMIGCNDCSDGCAPCSGNSQIEYWFYPQVEKSTLLVMFSFASEDVLYHESSYNSRFYIEVLDGDTDQLISSGYYPTIETAGTANEQPNYNWPYNRFLAVPSGRDANNDQTVWSDEFMLNIYYWAYQQATPTLFPYRKCPSIVAQTYSSHDVTWLEPNIIAFDLNQYAAQGNSVKLRIRLRGCGAQYHWAYGLFSAKMVPGISTVVASDNQPVFHLSVPWGFLENTYEWHYGYDAVDANNRYFNLVDPQAGITTNGNYDIYIDKDLLLSQPGGELWPYYCCKVRTHTGMPLLFEYFLREYHLDADFTYEQNGDSVHFQDASTVYYQTPPTSPTTGWDTIYDENPSLRWYVLQDEEFTLFAENENDPSFTFTPATVTDGQATVMLVISDNQSQVYDTVVKSFPISLSNVPAHERETVTVMPNPTSGSVRMSADQNIESIRILNADGKLLNTVTIQDKATTLDLSQHMGSIFLLDIRFQDGTSAVKKVVKR